MTTPTPREIAETAFNLSTRIIGHDKLSAKLLRELQDVLRGLPHALERLAWLPEPRPTRPEDDTENRGFNACLAEIEQHRSKP